MIVYIYNIGVDLYNGFNGLRHRINWTYFTVLDGLAHPLYSIKQDKTSNGKGGIIFLIIIGLLFGYGYMSLKKEEAEWDMAQKQYRIESRRKAEQNEFRAREEKRKKKEGQSSNSSSSSSSSYDEGSDDAYSGDYDEDRYDNDESYRDGVDDMLDELGE